MVLFISFKLFNLLQSVLCSLVWLQYGGGRFLFLFFKTFSNKMYKLFTLFIIQIQVCFSRSRNENLFFPKKKISKFLLETSDGCGRWSVYTSTTLFRIGTLEINLHLLRTNYWYSIHSIYTCEWNKN